MNRVTFQKKEPTIEFYSPYRFVWIIVAGVILAMVLAGMLVWWCLQHPSADSPVTLTVNQGTSMRSVAHQAAEANLVHSETLLLLVLHSWYEPWQLQAGTYRFTEPMTVFGVAAMLTSQSPAEQTTRLTIPEGLRVRDIAMIVAETFPSISATDYISAAQPYEGQLFPETYFIPSTYTAAEIVALQRATFEEKMTPFVDLFSQSPYTQAEILTLASIIEREANDEESMKHVSGILQRRLELGMALQADATIAYVLDEPINELPPGVLAQELRERESSYNTYKVIGLPPTPIGNPGLMAILAALQPTPSNYLYYITGNDGNFHYAETFTEHQQNIVQYLQ